MTLSTHASLSGLPATAAAAVFGQVFEASHHFQVLLNLEGRVLAASRSAVEAHGYQQDQVLGQLLWQAPWWAADAALSAAIEALFHAARLGTPTQAGSDYFASTQRLHADFTLTPLADVGGTAEYILVSGVDITERDRQQQFARRQEEILKSIASDQPVAQVLQDVIALADTQLAPLLCSITLLNPGGTHIQECLSRSLPDGMLDGLRNMKLEASTSICGRAVTERRPVYIEDAQTDPRCAGFRDRLLGPGFRACWAIPYFSADGLALGTVVFYARAIRKPSAQELTWMHALANILRIAIERDNTAKALSSSEAIVRAAFTATAAGIAVKKTDGTYLRANPAYCKTVGYTEDELLNVRSWQLVHPDDKPKYVEQIKQLVAGVFDSFTTEKRHIKKNGELAWMRSTISLLYQVDEMPPNLISVSEDITTAKLAEEALRRTQSLLQIASRMAQIGGWSVSFPDRRLIWSEEVAAIHEQYPGYAPSLECAFDHHVPEHRERMKAAFYDCASRGIPYDEESEIVTARGRRVWVRSTGEAIRDEHGRIIRVQGALQDISERKRADQDKQRTLTRLQRIADRVPGMLCEITLHADGSIRMPYASEHIRTIFRLSPQEAAQDASSLMRRVHPEDVAGLRAAIQASATQRTLCAHEFRLRFDDEQILWVRCDAMPYRETDDSVITWYGFLSDVTQSRQSQAHLRLLEQCIARLNDIVVITEAEPFGLPGPRTVFVNDAFERRTGYRPEEVLGKTPRILQGAKTQRSELNRIRAALEKWEPVRAELINYRKDGSEFWLELDIVPVADDKGWFTHWIAVERDITERKMAELDLARLNRALTMRGALSKAIIHASSEAALLRSACELALDVGGYFSAWIGFAQDDAQQSVQVAESIGPVTTYLDNIKISWAEDVPGGQGPAGISIREGRPVVCEDLSAGHYPRKWLDLAEQLGLRGVVSLPLRHQERNLGVFVLFLDEVRHLSQEEIDLLRSLADDLALAIVNLRVREEQQRVQQAISVVAASVSSMTEGSVFAKITQSMASALNADAAFISRLLPRKPGKAMTLAATVDGQLIDNYEYAIDDVPCRNLMTSDECVITTDLACAFPNCDALQGFGGQCYVGRALFNNSGEQIGMIFLIFRRPLRDVDFVVSTLKIFTSRAAAELQRQAANLRIRQQASLLDQARDAIVVRDLDHKLQYWNKSAERLYGWSEQEALGEPIDRLMYKDPSRFYRAHNMVLKHGEWSGEIQQRTKDGRSIFVDVRWTLVHDDDGTPQSILAINTDITARKAAQEEIQRLAFYDPLTNLPNRQLLIDRLRHTLSGYTRNHRIGALLFIDLDNFKTLNDTLGHHVGDLLLKEVAIRLATCVRKFDTVARLGGDEFVIMVTDLSNEIEDAVKQAGSVAEKVLQMLNAPYQVAHHEHFSTPSIGITLLNQQSPSSEEVLKQADLAMYQAKSAGRNTYRFYDTLMQSVVTNKVALEGDLRQALNRHQFLLHYQPQIDHKDKVIGAEVLLRWQHPIRGNVPPAQFIPLAEETRLIISIGAWVLEQACLQLASWAHDPDTAGLVLAVNVSAHQFRQPDFVKLVFNVLERTGVNPSRLKLELTESLLVDNVEDVIEKMQTLKARGVGFSLDDFGTGYSSLSYLKRLPLEQLKIDRSFVRDVLTDPNDASIARTVVALGQSLGLHVIAEGVETLEQREFLVRNGCYAFQGYLFSKPLPIAEFDAYLAQRIA